MRTNTNDSSTHIHTHEGAKAKHIGPEAQLLRSIRSCLLWEDEFYEDGQSIADRIRAEAQHVSLDFLASAAVSTRTEYNMRHVPLLLLCELVARNSSTLGHSNVVSDAIFATIQRADEMGEFVSLYWKLQGGKKPLAAQMKKGLARCFFKFDEYQFAKWTRDSDAVKPRDVMFLVHPKPRKAAEKELFKRIADGALTTPDTWEVALSGGADKKEAFEDLLRRNKLGYMALLRNLRNMEQAGVDYSLVGEAILARKGAERVLPFRFVAAARACPRYERELDMALCANIAEAPKLKGMTVVLVDVSASMNDKLSSRSDLTRVDAAAVLGSMINAEALRVFTFSNELVEVPPRRGMSGVDAIINSQRPGGTRLSEAVRTINNSREHDRLIVITDEQADGGSWGWVGGPVPDPVAKRAYMINVASAQNGVGYGKWTHIDGFSEQVLRFIYESEAFGDD